MSTENSMKTILFCLLFAFLIPENESALNQDIKELGLKPWTIVKMSNGNIELWLRDGIVIYHSTGTVTTERISRTGTEFDLIEKKYAKSL